MRSRGTSFALAGLTLLVAVAVALASGPASAGAAGQALPGQGFLPDGRAWELVSPPDKNGGDITGDANRSRASAGGDAFQFTSLSAFGDAIGTGVVTEYIAQRSDDPSPGTHGWSTHAITPRQEPATLAMISLNAEPRHQGSMSDDLDRGVFLARSPLPTADGPHPAVDEVFNLYVRDDLLTPGDGHFGLLTKCPLCAAPLPSISIATVPGFGGASEDFRNVVFESKLALAEGATAAPANNKVYESADGVTRLAGVLPGGQPAVRSLVGQGVRLSVQNTRTSRPIAADGSRLVFTVPPSTSSTVRDGALYQRIAGRTTVQLNASERAVPDTPAAATYWSASADHSRVLFTSSEALIDDAPVGAAPKLYMWRRADADEEQRLTVDASGGSFTLTLPTQQATGTGRLTSGSPTVTSVTMGSGAFSVGQEIAGPGIPPGTMIVAMGDFGSGGQSTLTLSAPATATATGQPLSAVLRASTGTLPHDIDAGQLREALEALAPIGEDNVEVTGGPGSAGGGTPYAIAFTGDLSGVNVPQLEADGAGLSGGGATAAVATEAPVENLTYLNLDLETGGGTDISNSARGVIGVSDDGRYVYFATTGQLVPGKPLLSGEVGLYAWHDGDVSYIGKSLDFGIDFNEMLPNDVFLFQKQSRVTPDGRHLVFRARSGDGLLSVRGGTDYVYDDTLQLYVYRADTDELACASCKPGAAAGTADGDVMVREVRGGSASDSNENRPLSDDGRYLFFTSAEALVPGDVNGRADAYSYDVAAGSHHLLSTGSSSSDSYFLGASASGDDAFFVTRERLVGWDVDGAYDVYDARVGGGFPQPAAAPPGCAGDACQADTAPPEPPLPSSAVLTGAGNGPVTRAEAAGRCATAKRQVARLERRARRLRRLAARAPEAARARRLTRRARRAARRADRLGSQSRGACRAAAGRSAR